MCDAAGVTQPVLYRLFGDKEGLLDAVAEHGFERYASGKAAQPRTADPVADLRAGWDNHMDFARRNPALYQLMFAPRTRSRSAARQRVFDLLQGGLVRCAAAGALKVEPEAAAQLILSANVGVALNLIAQPDLFDDTNLSHRMRDAMFGTVLTEPAPPARTDPVPAAAVRLRAQLSLTGTDALEPAETALLDRWLERLSGATAPEDR
ncbi:TetR/AcrR family transcriptional regulator [Amycolatopsis rhizosphaerae]|uniref:TetR/AcrR family transcriptional regulator n=1 Tax=Amycolatopsis rhizosphaerae TaxID=2053003 RepID=UPI001FE3F630|nr:TetR/AcrR family transcriptional regulator [Amycolatopsis rhizosphaerae]